MQNFTTTFRLIGFSVSFEFKSHIICDFTFPGNTLASEFTHELLYPNEEARIQLENAVSLKLIRKQREKLSGNMTLIFNIVYAPFKIMQ